MVIVYFIFSYINTSFIFKMTGNQWKPSKNAVRSILSFSGRYERKPKFFIHQTITGVLCFFSLAKLRQVWGCYPTPQSGEL
jgi:hypothetical protein